MSGAGLDVKVRGIPDLRAALSSIPAKLRVRALREALRAAGLVVRNAARARAPVISASAPAVRLGYRKPGTLRRAISVRNSKIARQQGDVGVFINVRPAPGAKFKTLRSATGGLKLRLKVRGSQRGAKSPTDPYYWRWVNFGHKTKGGHMVPGTHFLEAGADRLEAALGVFQARIIPAIERLNQRNAPAP